MKMAKSALCLDDVLENSPQTRCLLKLFEQDAQKLHLYTGRVRAALSRLLNAQVEIATSLHQLAAVLGEYREQDFPLDYGEMEFPAAVEKFQRTVTEIGSCMDIVTEQLQNCVAYPMDKFVKELDEVANRKEMYHTFGDDLGKSVERYAKLHKKEQQKKVEEVSEELCSVRRRFHQNGLRYYVQLNSLQYSRRILLLEPVLSLLYAYRSLFYTGHQALSQQSELTEFFTRTQEQVQSLHTEQQAEESQTKEFLKTISEIERLRPDIYYVEPLSTHDGDEGASARTVDTKITQKQGYLFMKTKATLMTRWEELYFFTQGGNLMTRGKDDLAGRVLLELTSDVGAGSTESEDRRNTFVITSGTTKKQLVFQALSQRDRDEWIYVINNLSRETTTGSRSPSNPADKESSGHGQPDPVVHFTAPIQFDLLSPLEEEKRLDEETTTAASGPIEFESTPRYKVRFLGCMEVVSDRGERMTSDATRQILGARLTHNIVLATEARMAFGGGKLVLLDCDQDNPKASFNLEDLSYWSTNNDNERLLALIVRRKGGGLDGRHKYNCYVLESIGTESAKEICDSLGAVTKAVFEAMCKKMATTVDSDDPVEKEPMQTQPVQTTTQE